MSGPAAVVAAPTILLAAGEPSGDLHGAAVARALRRRWPGVRLFGLGGPRMAEAGVELLADLDRLAVMGFAEVVKHLPYFAGLLRRVRAEMAARRTDLVLPVDYPGFNFRLARAARRRRIPVLYYIAPQVWAWHASRARTLAGLADRLAVILPFEQPLFAAAGARVSFVGHPLLDLDPVASTRDDFCGRLGLDPDRPVLAVLPGSRTQEVARHLALFTAAAERVRAAHPEVQPVIAASPDLPRAVYAGATIPLAEDARELLHHARAGLIKSGTSTLQAALAGTPLVVAYRTHPLTYWLARRVVRVDHIGLVNLVAGARVAPELVQDQATPAALSAALEPLLADGPPREAMTSALGRVRASLQADAGEGRGTADRVADLAAELLGARR